MQIVGVLGEPWELRYGFLHPTQQRFVDSLGTPTRIDLTTFPKVPILFML